MRGIPITLKRSWSDPSAGKRGFLPSIDSKGDIVKKDSKNDDKCAKTRQECNLSFQIQ